VLAGRAKTEKILSKRELLALYGKALEAILNGKFCRPVDPRLAGGPRRTGGHSLAPARRAGYQPMVRAAVPTLHTSRLWLLGMPGNVSSAQQGERAW
jgi:hypothetical protein